MDEQIKMSLKQGRCDEDIMHFQDLYASPAKSDASSVDIYDGLDLVTLTEHVAEQGSPSKNCLDLYEEILTEEGTAKEASFNDLSAEYEKCQIQMKQLITKLKEMQSLNSSLQNENKCLKKNISALIKTARVEITRKEEEINRLNMRLGAPGKNHSYKPYPLGSSINKSKSCNDDLSKNINTEGLPKKAKNLLDVTSRYSKTLSEKEKTCLESSQMCTTINPIAKPSKESTVYRLQGQTSESLCVEVNDKNRKKMGLDSRNKEIEKKRTKERPKSSFIDSVGDGSDLKEKARKSPLKCGKNESSQENRNSRSVGGCEMENRKYHLNSTEEKTQLKDVDHSKEKQVKKSERSPHRRESRTYEKEKNTESKHRTAEQNEEPRRSKRTHNSTLKDDGSCKLLEPNDGKRSSDAGRKDKHSSEYESKHRNKDSKPSKSENATRHKPNRENKSERSDRDRRGDDTKRTRDEQDGRHDQKLKGHQTKEKNIHQPSSKDKGLHSKVSEKNKNTRKAKDVDTTKKDMKLSFMETLNLTLSPVKKTSADTQQLVSSASSMECALERNITKGSSQISVIENNIDSHCPQNAEFRQSELVSMDNATRGLHVEDSKVVCQSGPVVDTMVCLSEQPANLAVDENTKLLAELTMEDKLAVSPVLDTVISKELDTHSVADSSDLDLDSFIEIDRCSGSPTSESPNLSMPAEQIQDDGSILEGNEDANSKAVKLKTNLTETPKELPPETDAKSTSLSVFEELNKENCQPDNKSDFSCKIPAVASPDEIEEGEILSEDEQICKQTIQTVSSPSQLVPDQVTTVTKSQSVQNSELLPLSKPDSMILPPEKSATKPKAKIATQPKLSTFPTSKRKRLSADSCLDGILNIVKPSSIQDILQMLRVIRKHIRKKYMKFKVRFSVIQFHRVIEAATLCFVTLVKSLDWSSLCSSPERLQKKLCRHIETRLKKLKKNGIVDRIFEQNLIDMKKRLWKFVEEQLDSLFDTLKTVILKLCDKAETEKSSESCTAAQKANPVKKSQNKRSKRMDKVCSPSSGSMPRLRSLEFHSQAGVSNPKIQNDNNNAVQKKLVNELTENSFNSENVDIPSFIISSTLKPPHLSPANTSTFNEPCSKSQLSSSGLSFNLVSDDHMGDIFKSLLHDSDNLPPDTLPESIWLLGTPEKTASLNEKFDHVDLLSENKTPSKAAFSWSSISPPHVHTFPRLEIVLNPDVFDENCLLEVPTIVSSSKTLNGSEDRLKSYSSVLLEDLAVSLTVPSPLKSDSHLSFLRHICDTEPLSEVDGKCCEGSVLDEEDVTEQDIHLTLDSDNSSIGSLEDKGELGSFQYHPSEPMQAVIMEKSNDHFIVKIRRAVSSSSPVCDSLSENTDDAAPEYLQTVEGHKPEMEPRLYTKSEAHNCSILVQLDHLDSANVTETSRLDVKAPEGASLRVQESESVFKLPPSRSPRLEIPAEIKQTADQVVEHSETDCEKTVTNCVEETCSPVRPADVLPLNISDANTVDLNLKKKRKSLDEEPSAKRQKRESPPDKDKGSKHNKTEDLYLEESNRKKHKRGVSDSAINFHSSKVSPSSLSAKNVIKKKGEVVVSWTRDEDRTILLQCQKIGPTKKTFLLLSSSMNKYPHQVEERFRQLMKLFKKSRNSSS